MAKEKEQEGAVANSSDALSVPKARVLAEFFAPNGKIRVELLPPEVVGGSAEGGSVNLQPLEERVAEHTTNIANNDRRITALERRPAPEIKWLKGKGRPDKPETTEFAIIGNEEDCTRYLSIDGAGVGAYEWEKRGDVWHVTRGDTGWRAMAFPGDSFVTDRESLFLLRRVGDTVFAAVGGDRDRGWVTPIFNMTEEAKRLIPMPRGFATCNDIFIPITADAKGVARFGADSIGAIVTAPDYTQMDHNYFHKRMFEVILNTRVWGLEIASCAGTIPEFNYSTVDPWPDTLPGEAFEIYYV